MVILKVVSGHPNPRGEITRLFWAGEVPVAEVPVVAVEIIINNTQLINYTQLISYLSYFCLIKAFTTFWCIQKSPSTAQKKSEAGEWVVAVSGGGLDHLAAPWHMFIRSTLGGQWSSTVISLS
jgi:hypothetical protein